MQGAPEAFSRTGGASEAFLDPDALRVAVCADASDLEWVPDVERDVVPEPLRQMCLGCPGRDGCLQSAIATGSQGYWAGTTTADRTWLAERGAVSVSVGEQLQAALRRQAARAEAVDQAAALHPAGQDSLWWYRRGGCRCRLCRGHNARRRGEERARARSRPQLRQQVSSAA